MKAICIGKNNWTMFDMRYSVFTLGKEYNYQLPKDKYKRYYLIKNDMKSLSSVNEFEFKNNFKDISKIRNKKLTELGI